MIPRNRYFLISGLIMSENMVTKLLVLMLPYFRLIHVRIYGYNNVSKIWLGFLGLGFDYHII